MIRHEFEAIKLTISTIRNKCSKIISKRINKTQKKSYNIYYKIIA